MTTLGSEGPCGGPRGPPFLFQAGIRARFKGHRWMPSEFADTYTDVTPSAAKRLNIASIRFGGNFAPPSSHQVSTAM